MPTNRKRPTGDGGFFCARTGGVLKWNPERRWNFHAGKDAARFANVCAATVKRVAMKSNAVIRELWAVCGFSPGQQVREKSSQRTGSPVESRPCANE